MLAFIGVEEEEREGLTAWAHERSSAGAGHGSRQRDSQRENGGWRSKGQRLDGSLMRVEGAML